MTAECIRVLEPLIPALRRYARSLLRDRRDADDLVQDCLERAISRWHQRRGDGHGDGNSRTQTHTQTQTRAWLFAILHNLAMTHFARAARKPLTVPLDDAVERTAHAPCASDPLQRRDILAALARLPEAQRAVLLLVAVEDLSYTDAARVLDIPVGTVMSRLSRARDRLHALLSDAPEPSLPRAKMRLVKS